MNTFFVDTSALIKRYIREPGSLWVRNWIAPESENLIVISEIAVVEMFSLLARRQRAGAFSPSTILRMRETFVADLQQDYLLLTVDPIVFDRAGDAAFDHGLKTLDALQLASAVRARDTLHEPIIFVSGDAELLVAAAAEGFAVDNPLNHP